MHITIVGGGFGGVKAALELIKSKDIFVTLISDKPDFLYYPALYGTATGHSHLESWVSLQTIFQGKPRMTLINDTIISIDPERKLLRGKSVSYEYENCILALGVVTTFFGIEGLDEYSYSIKSQAEIERFKQHIHADLQKKHQLDKHYVIVGAGPTGVELAGTLVSYLARLRQYYRVDARRHIHVNLVEAAPRVLPKMSVAASRVVAKRLKRLGVTIQTNRKVELEEATDLIVSGKPILTSTVIWTSGVANHPFFKAHEHYFKLAPNGRVIVNEQLLAYQSVYVIGDNAATPYSGLAQTALHDALFVARNLKRQQRQQPERTYKAVMPAIVVPVGEKWAIFEWHKLRLHGRLASWVRQIADLSGYHDILPIGQALGAWHAQRVLEDEVPSQETSVRKS